MARFVAAPAPPLPVDEHLYERDPRTRACKHCPLPRRNRVHIDALYAGRPVPRAEWAKFDAARLGEREP